MNCKRRYTTYEYVETPLTVIKRDGSRDTFDRGRLKKGIELALTKRSIPAQKVEKLISEVEEECQKLEQLEVDSSYIGELVMQKLRDIDEVAYIRFASVYRRFEDAGEFRKELDKM